MKKNLIAQLITISITALMMVVAVFAWISSNKEVTSNISVSVSGVDVTCKLYSWNSSWTTPTLSDLEPGDVVYFKLDITNNNDTATAISANFNGVSSTLSDLVIVNSNAIYIQNQTKTKMTKLYTFTEGRVMYDNQVLYLIDGTDIYLSYYKMEDMIDVYSVEGASSSTSGTIDAKTGGLADNLLTNQSVLSGQTFTYYFALKFNENASIAYAYQELIINKILIWGGGSNE